MVFLFSNFQLYIYITSLFIRAEKFNLVLLIDNNTDQVNTISKSLKKILDKKKFFKYECIFMYFYSFSDTFNVICNPEIIKINYRWKLKDLEKLIHKILNTKFVLSVPSIIEMIKNNPNKMICLWFLDSNFYSNTPFYTISNIETISFCLDQLLQLMKLQKLYIYPIVTTNEEENIETVQNNSNFLLKARNFIIFQLQKLVDMISGSNKLAKKSNSLTFVVKPENIVSEFLEQVSIDQVKKNYQNEQEANIESLLKIYLDFFQKQKNIDAAIFQTFLIYLNCNISLEISKMEEKKTLLNYCPVKFLHNDNIDIYFPFIKEKCMEDTNFILLMQKMGIVCKINNNENYTFLLEISRFINNENIEKVKNFIVESIFTSEISLLETLTEFELYQFFTKIPSLFIKNGCFSLRTSLIFASICYSENTILKEIAKIYLDSKRGKWINFDIEVNRRFEFVNQILRIKNFSFSYEELNILKSIFIVNKFLQFKDKNIGIKIIYENTKKTRHISKYIKNFDDFLKQLQYADYKINDMIIRCYVCAKCNNNPVLFKKTNIKSYLRCEICKYLELSCFNICITCNEEYQNLTALPDILDRKCCFMRFNEFIFEQNYEISIKKYFKDNVTDFLDVNIKNITKYSNHEKNILFKKPQDFDLLRKSIKKVKNINFKNSITCVNNIEYKILQKIETRKKIEQILMKFNKKGGECQICYELVNELFSACNNTDPVCSFDVCCNCLANIWHPIQYETERIRCTCCRRFV